MATSSPSHAPKAILSAPSDSEDLPPPYSVVIDKPPLGIVSPSTESFIPANKLNPQSQISTAPGVNPHPPIVTTSQPQAGDKLPSREPGPVEVNVPMGVGAEPATVTYNCTDKDIKLSYKTNGQTRITRAAICIFTMNCPMCCFGSE